MAQFIDNVVLIDSQRPIDVESTILYKFQDAVVKHISPSLLNFPKGTSGIRVVSRDLPFYNTELFTGLFSLNNVSLRLFDDGGVTIPIITLPYNCEVAVKEVQELFVSKKQFFDFVENRVPVFDSNATGMRLFYKVKD
jgi:hypothetical protein